MVIDLKQSQFAVCGLFVVVLFCRFLFFAQGFIGKKKKKRFLCTRQMVSYSIYAHRRHFILFVYFSGTVRIHKHYCEYARIIDRKERLEKNVWEMLL